MIKSNPRVDTLQVLSSLEPDIPWARGFFEALINVKDSKKAFDLLIAEGCELRWLLTMLDLACSRGLVGSANLRKEAAMEAVEFAKLMGPLSARLIGLERLLAVHAQLKINQHPEFQKLGDKMKSYVDCLREDAATLQASRLTVRTTPQFGVAWLVAEVEGRTGEPHHKEIARLMSAYYVMRGLPKRFSARAVEKRAIRYKIEVPYMYDLLQGMARMRPKPEPA